MANIARTVEILFQAKDQMSMKLTGINQGLELLKKTVNALLDPLAQLGDAIISLDRSIASYATTLGTDVLDASMSLESVLIDLKRLLGEQTGQFDELVESSRDLSREFGVALEDVIQSVIEFKRANFDAKESLDLTREALTLVRVGFVDMHTATESLVKILKGFGVEAERANEIVDILSITSNTYATNVEKLAIGMAELAPIASKVGFSMAETAGLATKVIEVFQSGEEAATALKTGFTRLATGSAQVQKAYDKLGISGEDANGMLKNGKTILGEIAGAMGKFSEAEQVQISAWLVGNRQAQKMVDIFTDYNKTIEIGIKALSDRQYAEKQLVLVMESTKVQLERMETGWIELKSAMGDEFLPIVSLVLQGLHEIETALTDTVNAGALKEVASRLIEYGEKVKTYLQGIARAIPDALKEVNLSPLIASWEEVAATLEKIFNRVKIENAEDLADKIQILVEAMALLIKITNGMLKPWTDLTDKLLSVIPVLGAIDEDMATSFGNMLGHVQMIEKLGFIWYGVFRAMGDDVETFENRTSFLMDKVAATNKDVQLKEAENAAFWARTMSYYESSLNIISQAFDKNAKSKTEWAEKSREADQMLKETETEYIEFMKNNLHQYKDALDERRKIHEQMVDGIKITSKEYGVLTGTVSELTEAMHHIPVRTEIIIETPRDPVEVQQEFLDLGIEISHVEGDKYIVIKTQLDGMSIQEINDRISAEVAKRRIISLALELDKQTVEDVNNRLSRITEPTRDINIKMAVGDVELIMEQLSAVLVELDTLEETDAVIEVRAEVEQLFKDLSRVATELEKAQTPRSVFIAIENFKDLMAKLGEIQGKLDDIPDNKKIEIEVEGAQEAKATFDGLNVVIGETPEEVEVKVKATIDEKAFDSVTKRIDVLAKDANEKLKIEASINTKEIEAAASVMAASIEADANKAIAVIQSLADSIGRVSDNVGGMFSSIASMYDRIIDLGEKQIDMLEETEQTFEDLRSEIEETIGALDAYLDKMEEITDAIDDQEDSVDDLERELAQYEKALKRIEDGIDTEQIERDLKRIQNEIKEVEKELSYLYDQPYSPENEAKIAKLERELEYLKKEEELLGKTMADSASAREEFEKKILDLKKEIWEAQKEINDLAGDLPEIIGDASKEWDDWMGKITDAKGRLQELYDLGLISEAEYNTAMNYLNELEQKVMGFLGELEAMGIDDIEDVQRETAQQQLKELQALKEELRKQTETLEGYLSEQMDLQEKLIHKQLQLVDAQIEQIEARTKMMKEGDSMIKIQADGLEPELEAFMWKILENLQVRANQEFSEFLIGLRGLNLTSVTGSL